MDKITNLTDAEKQLLDATLSIELYPEANPEEADENIPAGEKMALTAENLRKRGRLIQETTFGEKAQLLDWTPAYPRLEEVGLIQCDDDIYQLTDAGRIQARLVRTERVGKRFSDYHARCAGSAAHAEFCQRVFGKNLCQADVMDMAQLEQLLDVLDLSAENRVLDLACGMGGIAEYISDATGARVVGIDIAEQAITLAQERTRHKRERLEFRYADMNDLSLAPASFDTVIAIAALHYTQDLDKTIRQLVEILTPSGQMGLFAFQYASESDLPDVLLPENTDLGRVLQKYSLDFQAWDFTAQEIQVLCRQVQVARELMEAYREEGNLDVCEDRIEESETDLQPLEAGLKRRYLYHVRL
jgi:ubiquinone/menaquinone biosynthesis C-methylase UbiE